MKILTIFLFLLGIILSFFLGYSFGNNPLHSTQHSLSKNVPTEPKEKKKERIPSIRRLPVLWIETDNKKIPDEPRIPVTLKIYSNYSLVEKNRLHLEKVEPLFENRIGIEQRGGGSIGFAKKQYRFEVWDNENKDLKVSLLGLPKESDWILYGPYVDKSLIRNALVYSVSNRIGRYAPRSKFVELFIDERNEKDKIQAYQGIYLLMEKIKRGKKRVALKKNKNLEASKITGGYLFKIDSYKENETILTLESNRTIVVEYPKAKNIHEKQIEWLKNYLNLFEQSLQELEQNPNSLTFTKYMDISSFVDIFLIEEAFRNLDGFFSSLFFHKDRGGKIKAGPVWDYNLSMGNCVSRNVSETEGWHFKQLVKEKQRGGLRDYQLSWWHQLLRSPAFKEKIKKRWKELRKSQLLWENIEKLIDEKKLEIFEAHIRNFAKWRVLGKKTWYAGTNPTTNTHQGEIQILKNWLKKRFEWIDLEIEKL